MRIDVSGSTYIARPSRRDLARALVCAWERNELKVHAGVQTKKFLKDRDDLTTHVIGILAEMAVAESLGASIEMDARLTGDDHEADHRLPSGERIQTKYRLRRGWDFALSGDSLDEFKADYGVLVWPEMTQRTGPHDLSMEIVGYVSRAEFQRLAVTKDYGYGPRLVIEAQHFRPIHELTKHSWPVAP